MAAEPTRAKAPRPVPPAGLRDAAARVAEEAARLGLTAGVPRYNPDLDARAAALPSFPEFVRRLGRVRRLPPLYGPSETERLALAWVYASLGGPAAQAWLRYWADLVAPAWTYFAVANLQALEGDADEVGFDDGLSIRLRDLAALARLTNWPREVFDRALKSDWMEGGAPSSYVVIATDEIPKGPDNVVLATLGQGWRRVRRLLLAMRLAGPGEVGIGRLFEYRRGLALTGGVSSLSMPGSHGFGDAYRLSSALVAEVQLLYRQLLRFESIASRFPQLETALARFEGTYGRPWPKSPDRLIDEIIALEALVGTTDELSFTIAFRVSGLLERDDSRRLDLFNALKDFYSGRSAIVHGQPSKPKARWALEHEPELHDVVRKLLRGLVRLVGTATDPTPALFRQGGIDAILLDRLRREDLVALITA